MKSMISRKIPEEFRPCFWDTDFDTLDTESNKGFIISRLYVKGGIRGIFWVEHFYTAEEIAEAARSRRNLNPIVANYLRKKYGLKKEEMRYYQMVEGKADQIWRF